jgi:predicted transcriptional regulator
MRRGEIYNKIVEILKINNSTIQQISKQTNIRWETIKNAVESLKKAGFIDQNDKKFYLKKNFSYDYETLLGIPISKSQKKEIAEIANRFKELVNFNNTFLQKAVINVIQKNNLNLPYGWYLYGPCNVLILNDENLKNFKSTKKYDKTIKNTINEFKIYKNTNELMEKIYENNIIYLSRLQIEQIFKEKLTINTMKQIELTIKQMLFNLKEPSFYYLDSYLSNISILKKLNEDELNDTKLEIYSTFRIIWEIIGTQILKETLNIENIDFYFNNRINTLKEIANFHLLKLKDYWPKIEYSLHIKNMRKKYLK